jgi:LSD1 subclass zinc finger protein
LFESCAADAPFLVVCPLCSAALQIYAGTSSVRCDFCDDIFKVSVSQSHLPARALQQRPRREPRRARKLPSVLAAFNQFKKAEMARLAAANPTLTKRERFTQACANWRAAPENPKNGGAAMRSRYRAWACDCDVSVLASCSTHGYRGFSERWNLGK